MSMDKDNHSDELRGAVLHALIERGQSPLDTRLAQQAAGAHPAPCARHCEATEFHSELRRLQSENEQLRAGYDAARLEIASLRDRVQQLGQPAAPAQAGEYPELPSNFANVLRRIGRCESERAAQVVLENAMRKYADATCAACGAAQAQDARQPLTDDQIERLAEEHGSDIDGFARAIEHHHGIK